MIRAIFQRGRGRRFAAALAVLGVAALAYGASYNRTPFATFATASAVCSGGTPVAGDTCWVVDCNSTSNCTAGGGANAVFMMFSGAAWVHVMDDAGFGAGDFPDSSISHDEIGGGIRGQAIFCGDLPNNTTHFTSPSSGYPGGIFYNSTLTAGDLDFDLAGAGCAAEDSTTEATADEIMFTGLPVKVHGMYCRVSSSGSNGVTLRVRSAAANLTPDVTCTIATSATECRSITPSTTDVAANATVAVAAVSTEDLSAQDFWCLVDYSIQ